MLFLVFAKHITCHRWAITSLGFNALALKPNMAETYAMLLSIYVVEGKWQEAERMRKLMKRATSKKEVGRSWNGIRNQVYCFAVGNKMGSHIEWVDEVLELPARHMKEAGYVPELDCFIHDQEEHFFLSEMIPYLHVTSLNVDSQTKRRKLPQLLNIQFF